MKSCRLHTKKRKKRNKVFGLLLILLLLAAGCVRYVPPERDVSCSPFNEHRLSGLASWYGEPFHGRKTASGETYNMFAFTAAHKTLPFGLRLLVVNQTNRKEVMVRINDRGPFVKKRIIDLSYAAAQKIDLIGPGTAPVILQPIPTRLEPQTHRYFIQVGSFLSRSNARKSLSSLGQTWKNSRIQEASVQGNRFWRVQIGAYAGLPEARRVRANLNRDYPGCFIVAD